MRIKRKDTSRIVRISAMTARMRRLKKLAGRIGKTAIVSLLCLLFCTAFAHLYIDMQNNGVDGYLQDLSNEKGTIRLVADKILQGDAGIYNLGLIFNQEIAYRNIGEQNFNNEP